MLRCLWFVLSGLLMVGLVSVTSAAVAPPGSPTANEEARTLDQLPAVVPHGSAQLDHSGRKERGSASYYARRFARRRMADGRRMNPNDNAVASKTLPLGTTAVVTNLRNGRTTTVRVEDRGPFVGGRVVDVSPAVARDLDINRRGLVAVVVKPIAVPQRDGQVKLGAGAAEVSPRMLQQAIETTKALAGRRHTHTG